MVGVVGFYNPDRPTAVDNLCRAGFLGNFEHSPAKITITPPHGPAASFNNAESAFQALKFWNNRHQFNTVTGSQAYNIKRTLVGREDYTYSGFGSNWNAMWAVLEAKFLDPVFRQRLLNTGDAYLLEHNEQTGRDNIWSDNHDGTGTNWLGLQLMLLRDQLGSRDDWTSWISRQIDLMTGKPLGSSQWQTATSSATASILTAIRQYQRQPSQPSQSSQPFQGGVKCVRPCCFSPSYNGQRGEFCSITCRDMPPSCLRRTCIRPTYNGKWGEYCSKSCKNSGPQICIRPSCGKPQHPGHPYCGRFCASLPGIL